VVRDDPDVRHRGGRRARLSPRPQRFLPARGGHLRPHRARPGPDAPPRAEPDSLESSAVDAAPCAHGG
jgi:hypothetical protein